MNIQIFGKKKCFDTKKAERYFKERRVKFQKIDMNSKGMSQGELKSVIQALSFDEIVDEQAKGYHESLIPYTSDMERKLELLEENPQLIKTPIVRNGKKATLGYQPEVWATWN